MNIILHVQQIKNDGFSKKLIKDIRQATKNLYTKTKERSYVLSDGKKLTKARLSAFYSQLSQWQYLHDIMNKKQSLNGDVKKDNKQVRTGAIVDNNDDEVDEQLQLEAKNNKEDSKAIDTKKTLAKPNNKNLLKHTQNSNNINDNGYPKILNHNDLTAILKDPEADQLASESAENKAIFSNIMKILSVSGFTLILVENLGFNTSKCIGLKNLINEC